MNDWVELTEEKERKIDIKQFFLFLLDHIVLILIIFVIFASSACGYAIYKHNKDTSLRKVLDSIIKQNQLALYPESSNAKIVRNTDLSRVDRSCIVKCSIYVEFSPQVKDDLSKMIARYQQDALLRLRSDSSFLSIANEVNSRDYENDKDTKELSAYDVRWMFNSTFNGTNVIIFSITDVSKDRALDIASLIAEKFIEEAKSYDAFESCRVIDEPSVIYDSTSNTKSISIKTLIKYVLLGGGGSVFIVFVVLLLYYIITDRVRTASDVDFVDYKTLARIPVKDDKKSSEYKRLAYTISLNEKYKNLMLVPADSKTEIDEIIENVSKELNELKKDIKLTKSVDLISSPDALLDSKDCDAIIIAATFASTPMKKLEYSKREIEKTGKEVMGVVINSCRH